MIDHCVFKTERADHYGNDNDSLTACKLSCTENILCIWLVGER